MKKLVLYFVEPIARFIALFRTPSSKVSSMEFIDLKNTLRNGDILVSRTNWELSNVFMPGYWKHVGIWCDGMVYEAVTDGTRKTLLEEFFFKKDHVGLCRLDGLDANSIETGKAYLEIKLGSLYDWSFEMNMTNRIYCSELAYFFLCTVSDTFDATFRPSFYLGEKIIRPSDLWNSLRQIGKWE